MFVSLQQAQVRPPTSLHAQPLPSAASALRCAGAICVLLLLLVVVQKFARFRVLKRWHVANPLVFKKQDGRQFFV